MPRISVERNFDAAGKLFRELLNVASGGVVFTTIQKFFPDEKGSKHPLLSDRRNIVVIADEGHWRPGCRGLHGIRRLISSVLVEPRFGYGKRKEAQQSGN